MKKVIKAEDDELLPEYDFSKLKGAVRGKYFKAIPGGRDRPNHGRWV